MEEAFQIEKPKQRTSKWENKVNGKTNGKTKLFTVSRLAMCYMSAGKVN